jgi:hypothetical protein
LHAAELIRGRRPRKTFGIKRQGGIVFFLLLVAFLLGSFIGAVLGVNSTTESIKSIIEGITDRPEWSLGLIESLWNCSKYIIAAIFLAGSVYGILLIPALCAVRGYFLGCSAASIISAVESGGWLLSFIVVGIPALITVPCLFVIGTDGLATSKRLIVLTKGSYSGGKSVDLARHTVICSVIILLAAIINEYLVPALAGLIL